MVVCQKSVDVDVREQSFSFEFRELDGVKFGTTFCDVVHGSPLIDLGMFLLKNIIFNN